MKRNNFLYKTVIYCASAILLFSCQKEMSFEGNGAIEVRLAANYSANGTKSSLDGLAFKWHKGDKISLFYSSEVKKADFTVVDKAEYSSNEEFKGEIDANNGEEFIFYGVSPFDTELSNFNFSEKKYNVKLPQLQVQEHDAETGDLLASSIGKYDFKLGLSENLQVKEDLSIGMRFRSVMSLLDFKLNNITGEDLTIYKMAFRTTSKVIPTSANFIFDEDLKQVNGGEFIK